MDNQRKKPVAVVVGAGPGLGASLSRRFAKTYSVAILAPKADYLKTLAGELRQSGATVQDLTCDVRERTQITDAFRAIREELATQKCSFTMPAAVASALSRKSRPISTKRTGGSTPAGRLSRPKKLRPQ